MDACFFKQPAQSVGITATIPVNHFTTALAGGHRVTKQEKQGIKVVVGTVSTAIAILVLQALIGYERAELLAFSLLIGLSIAALK